MGLAESSWDQTLFSYALVSLLVASPLSFLSLHFLSAPYGKHRRPGWGPLLYPPLAWFLMESPTLWLSLVVFPFGRNALRFKALVLYSPFVSHYFHRTLFYPLRLHLRQISPSRNTAFQKANQTPLPKGISKNTADRETAFGNTADRKTVLDYKDGRKTDGGETVYWESDGLARRKTGFENTADRETAFVNTGDRTTAFDDTSDRESDGSRSGEGQTSDQKTTSLKTGDQGSSYRKTASGFPASIALMAFSFNIWNTYLQARWVSHYADLESDEWFWWRFCVGMAVFVTGMAVNIWSDSVLVGLKSENGKYRVPKGGLFEFVSCPNYFGEVVEWFGWALMTRSWVGVGFFLFTCSNLVPRARSNHKWYLDKFGEDYPKNRKAVIPFLY